MSLEGPHTFLAPEYQSGRPDAYSTKSALGLEITYASRQQYHPTKRILPPDSKGLAMPVSTSSQSLLASLPSFMSVFGNGSDRLETNEGSIAADAQNKTQTSSKRPHPINQFSAPTTRRDSTSTFESVESSPTTTISTVESALTEPSPSSPPESPESLLPLNTSFKYLRTKSVPGQSIMDNHLRDHFSNSFPILPGIERSESPNKKSRNMKNLSVNTAASNQKGPQLSKVGFSNQLTSSHAFSAPPTSAFIVPPIAPRKKPSNLGLTITTPEISSSVSSVERPNVVPQTPSDPQIRTLRLLQTTSTGALFSPTVAPEGGMRLPPFSKPSTTSRFGKAGPPLSVSPQSSFENTISSPITKQTLDHVQEETDYDVPLSQELKSPAYPQGPVCIYDPHVYLYLEPSHIEAREFDVVLNVAREVENPFKVAVGDDAISQIMTKDLPVNPGSQDAHLAGRDSASDSQTTAPEWSFDSTMEVDPKDSAKSVPNTPKATKPEPEYIHVPWDHNTNVVDDLLKLCELIDDRVRQDKRVLVHCQCGVSRSASLVVAYGIYKNPQLTVQEAYDAVKNRSRWIGPNMNLIYQLSEFKSKLPQTHMTGTSAWHSWRNLGSARSNPHGILSPSAASGLQPSSLRSLAPKTLSEASHLGRETPFLRANSFSPPISAQLVQRASAGNITPGPSSAPPDYQWSPQEMHPIEDKDGESVLGKAISGHASPQSLMNAEGFKSLSPTPMKQEAIEQRESAPTGGVAHDLEEVAKDLSGTDHGPETAPVLSAVKINHTDNKPRRLSPPMAMDVDTDKTTSPIDVSNPVEITKFTEPSLPTSSPTLPAGFSSLLSRRQGPLGLRKLPLRQDPPRLVPIQPTTQIPPRALDPDVPSTPSLLSPRAAEFTASPFHRTAAGDLAGSSIFEQGLMSPKTVEEDPRSPHQKGEAPITRSIFDMI